MRRHALLRVLALTAGLGAVPWVAGCSGAEAAEVIGKVTLNGQPLQAGKVTFYDPNRPGRNVIGDIKPDGSYRVFACPTGNVRVTVQPLPPPSVKGQPLPADGEGHKGGKRGSPPPPRTKAPGLPAIDPKYSDPATTDLVCLVKSGIQTFDIDLKP